MVRLEPRTIDEACDLVRRAAQAGDRLLISGGGTKSPAAAAPSEPSGPDASPPPPTLLGTLGLARLIDLSPGDLTCTVEAGIALQHLDALLAPHHLRLPLDPPTFNGRATLGGVLADNDSGPLRLAYGAGREHVIGMSMILADGTLIKAGGRVVKNVAGYDLHRLFVGSRGALGLIATVSLKLRPRAEAMQLVVLIPDTLNQADEWTQALLSGPTRPALIEWLRDCNAHAISLAAHAASGHRAPLMVVGYEDCRDAVAWQVAETTRAFPRAAALDPAASREAYGQLRERLLLTGPTTFKLVVPPQSVAAAFGLLPADLALQAHGGCGVIHGSTRSGAGPVERELDRVLDACGGWRRIQPASGRPLMRCRVSATEAALERAIKQKLDPVGIWPDLPDSD